MDTWIKLAADLKANGNKITAAMMDRARALFNESAAGLDKASQTARIKVLGSVKRSIN